MRTAIKMEEIKPGFKAFVWGEYCVKVDRLRRELIPGYDPAKLSVEDQMRDWRNFEMYYESKYGKYDKAV